MLALFISICIGRPLIALFRNMQLKQVIGERGPSSHKDKFGTPTFGGAIILISFILPCLLFTSSPYVVLVMVVTLLFAVVGFLDDYLKLLYSSSDGLPARYKYLLQSLVTCIVIYILAYHFNIETKLLVPYMKDTYIELGSLYYVLIYFVIVGSSNAVNLTDGLDGLAIVPALMITAALGVFAYLSSHIEFANYLHLPYNPDAAELSICLAAMVGASLGFLWYNSYPAQVFMGDVGSLAIGAQLGLVAVLIKQEIILFIMSGIFVIETVSVILQVMSFKLTGKRILKMAPIHHHFELSGLSEPKIIVRFWIISAILVFIGLVSIKVR